MLFFSSPAVVPLAGATVAPCFLIEKNCQKKSLLRNKGPVELKEVQLGWL